MRSARALRRWGFVALLAEGVDRNQQQRRSVRRQPGVALLAEGVDRNANDTDKLKLGATSPSSRRVWIEIRSWATRFSAPETSPSSRRAWIEMSGTSLPARADAVALLAEGVDRNTNRYKLFRRRGQSPSSRRAWIEITLTSSKHRVSSVALLAEGVDRNRVVGVDDDTAGVSPSSRRAWIEIRPPTGAFLRRRTSPSSRRAWIEITRWRRSFRLELRRPPRGGRG